MEHGEGRTVDDAVNDISELLARAYPRFSRVRLTQSAVAALRSGCKPLPRTQSKAETSALGSVAGRRILKSSRLARPGDKRGIPPVGGLSKLGKSQEREAMDDQPKADSPAPPAHAPKAVRLAAFHDFDAAARLVGAIEEQNRIHLMEDQRTTTPVRINHHLSNHEPDPTRWVDSWTDLSDASRERLKVEILTAYSDMFGILLQRYERLHLFWNRVLTRSLLNSFLQDYFPLTCSVE